MRTMTATRDTPLALASCIVVLHYQNIIIYNEIRFYEITIVSLLKLIWLYNISLQFKFWIELVPGVRKLPFYKSLICIKNFAKDVCIPLKNNLLSFFKQFITKLILMKSFFGLAVFGHHHARDEVSLNEIRYTYWYRWNTTACFCIIMTRSESQIKESRGEMG